MSVTERWQIEEPIAEITGHQNMANILAWERSGKHMLTLRFFAFGPNSDVCPRLSARSAFVTDPALPPVGGLR